MKKLSLMMMTAMMLTSASALAGMRIDFNGGAQSLPECRGTIEAKGGIMAAAMNGSAANQINLIVRGSENCSNFIMETTGKEYKLQGPNGNRGGSYTLTADKLNPGWNQVNLTVRSDTGKHYDPVSVWVYVESAASEDHACSDEAEAAARDKYYSEYNRYAKTADAAFERKSNAGNYVFEVTVRGRAGAARYEAVMRPDCSPASGLRALN